METPKTFVVVFMSAISNCMLYSKNHASVDELAEKAFAILNALLKRSDTLTMMIIEDELIINKNPERDIGLQGKNLIKRLKRRGISHIEFLKGIVFAEFKQLVDDMAKTEKVSRIYPHVKIGVADIGIDTLKIERNSHTVLSSDVTSEQIQKMKEEYNRISPFKKLNIGGFQEIVARVVLMLKKEISILALLNPVQTHTEYHYTHATNVAALTMFQAASIGIQGDTLQDVGIAALLHDVGKLLIPTEPYEQQEPLAGKERVESTLHPFYGAQYLATIDHLTHLAPIVAFEHHLRYDGRGYPQLKVQNYKQHICSQLTAIADCFDTLRSAKPYQKALEVREVLSLMKTKDEGLFNPFLLDNFMRSIHLALSL